MFEHRPRMGLLWVAALLASCGGASSPQDPISAGRALYANNCIACHGAAGSGNPPLHPAIMGSALVAGEPRALVRWVLLGERPPDMPRPPNAVPMPQYGWLRDEDVAALLSYVRATFGAGATPLTPADVATARRAR